MKCKVKARHLSHATEAASRASERRALPQKRASRSAANVDPAWEMVDDLSPLVPVTQREVEIVETYLGELLDAALAETGTKKD